jgi:hypothetical protein
LEICATFIGAASGFTPTLIVAISPPRSVSVLEKGFIREVGDTRLLRVI